MDDTLVLIAGLHKQNETILQEVKALRETVNQLQAGNSKPLDVWVIGFSNLRQALLNAGMLVGVVKLRKLREVGVLRDEEECKNIGTETLPRFRFNVGRCKAAIARFESLPVVEQRRILGQ